VGSIGVLQLLYDESRAYEAQGIKVHVLSTGPFKGAGASEAPIPKEHVDYYQRLIDSMGGEFQAAIARGRGQKASVVAEWATGEVWIGREAKDKGLVDAVETIDGALAWLRRETKPRARNRAELAARELSAREDPSGGSL